jgi:predicted DCC family thiol-disulfide oxidoreductase YuxK
MTSPLAPLKFFHDGSCPLCQAEVIWLRSHTTPENIEFIDIAGPRFEKTEPRLDRAEAFALLHGRVGDGPLIRGPEVLIAAYQRSSLPLMRWLVAQHWLRPVLDAGYRVFARHRRVVSRAIGPLALYLAQSGARKESHLKRRKPEDGVTVETVRK